MNVFVQCSQRSVVRDPPERVPDDRLGVAATPECGAKLSITGTLLEGGVPGLGMAAASRSPPAL